MDDEKRLELIAEAVRYCQRIKAMGMPSACYSKALREPVHFLWERRDGKGKEHAARFRSKAAAGMHLGGGMLVYDHAVPFKILEAELLRLQEVTVYTVHDILSKYGTVVIITKEEDGMLSRLGYRSRMPDKWDGLDPLARYKAASIEIIE